MNIKTPRQRRGVLQHEDELLDCYFSAANRLAAKSAYFALCVGDHAILGGVNREIAAHGRAFAGALCHADLPDDDLANLNFFTTKQLNTKSLTGGIVNIFGGTASFDV
jgi:hypothetical protein